MDEKDEKDHFEKDLYINSKKEKKKMRNHLNATSVIMQQFGQNI